MSEIEDLQQRLAMLTSSTCNTIGCDNCGLKFGGHDSKECSATELQNRIFDIEFGEKK